MSTAGNSQQKIPRRVVGKGDQDKNDIPPFELLHSAEKVPVPNRGWWAEVGRLG